MMDYGSMMAGYALLLMHRQNEGARGEVERLLPIRSELKGEENAMEQELMLYQFGCERLTGCPPIPSEHSKCVPAWSSRWITRLSLGILPLMIGVIAMHRPRHSSAELRDDTPQVEEPGVNEEEEAEHV